MVALTHTSHTSVKNCRIASSVCGLVGLVAIEVEVEEDEDDMEDRGREDVEELVEAAKLEVKGNVPLLAGGGVLGGCGRCRRRNLTEVGVRKQEMWEVENLSMTLRYLRDSTC